jgi:DNA helicase-2/ATP-dependent DNA helicase PcrA
VPATLYNRYQDRSEPAVPSPFVRELPDTVYVEWRETYAGGLALVDRAGGVNPEKGGNGGAGGAGGAGTAGSDGRPPFPTSADPAGQVVRSDRPHQPYPAAGQDQGRGIEGARDARTLIQSRRPGGWTPPAGQGGWPDRANRGNGGAGESGGAVRSGAGGPGAAGGTGPGGFGPGPDDGDLPGHGYADPANPATPPDKLGYCRHKIFGRGKIVAEVPPGKYRVNFPGFGLKVIMADYLVLE